MVPGGGARLWRPVGPRSAPGWAPACSRLSPCLLPVGPRFAPGWAPVCSRLGPCLDPVGPRFAPGCNWLRGAVILKIRCLPQHAPGQEPGRRSTILFALLSLNSSNSYGRSSYRITSDVIYRGLGVVSLIIRLFTQEKGSAPAGTRLHAKWR